MVYDLAVIPGDGIGIEVIDATLPLLEDVGETYGFSFDRTRYDWGSERYLNEGTMMPEQGTERLKDHDAILLGAVGHPEIFDHITLRGLMLPIRKALNQQVCRRPSVLFDGVQSPLRDYEGGDIDFVVFRENTEGEYSDIGGIEHRGFGHEVAFQSAVFTREGTETVVRAAFEEAQNRSGKLTNVTKSNAQAYGMVFWDEIVTDVSEEFPDVEVERLLVDAASMDLIRRPEDFDVIVASNLFGDILTDIGAIISGSMGLAPSANINIDREFPSMFEPVHGSAPDIAGKGIANPLATVLSESMLLDQLGETDAADELWNLVVSQLTDPDTPQTPDLDGDGTTNEVVTDLQQRL
jgi:tartrate dehydrogenase/decarboxylase/D-malate dehydrogenase